MTPTAMPKPERSAQRGDTLKLRHGSNLGEVSNVARTAKGYDKPPFFCAFASSSVDPPISGASDSVRGGRGGARNRADRQSEGMNAGQVDNLIAATRYAEAIGLPFTRMITIHWQEAGVALEQMVKATGDFIDLLSRSLKRWGSKTAWLYVHEGGVEKGGHCHLLIHVPASLVAAVSKAQKRWLRSITGLAYRARVICSRPIGGRLDVENTNPALHALNLEAAFLYVLKGADKEASKAFGLIRLAAGGLVIGKRCGTSQNISAKARANAGTMA